MNAYAFVRLVLQDAAALVIVKATVVLALATAAALAAKRFSAARRHLLWLAALSSCVWLVLSSPVVPAMTIHTPNLAAAEAIPAEGSAIDIAIPKRIEAATAGVARLPRRLQVSRASRRSTLVPAPVSAHLLLTIWIVGCVVLLVRHTIGVVGATQLSRRAVIADDDDETARDLASVAALAGVRRSVRLAYSTELRTPITFGVVTPHVILPIEAASWPIERRRAVLVHESAHVARGDWLSQAIGQVACDLFWFHPLAWYAFARLRDEAERAADDSVLRTGLPAVDYATHLLALARRATNTRPDLATVGIVSADGLEQRFAAMLDAKRPRTAVTSRARAVATSVALAIVCPLSSLRVGSPVRLTTLERKVANVPSMAAPPMEPIRSSMPGVSKPRSAGARPASPASPSSPRSSIAVAEHLPPSPIVHPDFTGKWAQDTSAGPSVDFLLTDSTNIEQSARTISFESHGHMFDEPIVSSFQNVSFDGSESRPEVITGISSRNVTASALWAGDTLVLTTYAIVYGGAGAHDVLTIERMTLGRDGNTLSSDTESFADGQMRWGRPRMFVLRRIAP